MQALVAGRKIAAGGRGEADLAVDANASTETIAIAFRASQGDSESVILAAAIRIQLGMLAERRGNHIDGAAIA